MAKLKVLSLFSGIGAFEKALTNIGLDYELIGFSEIDKYAIESYCAMHDISKDKNLGDVSKVDFNRIEDFDLMTYGFPCQDISIAGKQRGFMEGTETRSSLLWEAMKIARIKKPKYMIAENVKNLIGKKFKDNFDKYINYLDEIGYNTYYQVLNAKNFGVPQNRERVFVVSIRKDINKKKFEFPIGKDEGIRLKDILEKDFDKKYILSEKAITRLINNNKGFHSKVHNENSNEVAATLFASMYKIARGMDLIQVGNINPSGEGISGRVYHTEGISPVLDTTRKNILDKSNRIRRLTPLECFRLMGFSDEDFHAVKNIGISDSQLYKQAGNSIVVNVLEALLHKLFEKELAYDTHSNTTFKNTYINNDKQII